MRSGQLRGIIIWALSGAFKNAGFCLEKAKSFRGCSLKTRLLFALKPISAEDSGVVRFQLGSPCKLIFPSKYAGQTMLWDALPLAARGEGAPENLSKQTVPARPAQPVFAPGYRCNLCLRIPTHNNGGRVPRHDHLELRRRSADRAGCREMGTWAPARSPTLHAP